MSTPTRPTVFLSYSHRDEGWKDRVATALRALELRSELVVWDDRRIGAGDGWFSEIEKAMNRAAVAVLLVSTDFLASGFITGTEVPHLLKRRQEEGLRVIPLFVRPSPWQAVDWLAAIQGRPKDAKPLSKLRKAQADEFLAELALEIWGWLNDGRKEPVREAPNGGAGIKPGVSTPGSTPPTTPSPKGAEASARGGNPGRAGDLPASLRDLEMGGGPSPGVETPGFMPAPPKGALPRLDLGRLPIAGPLLIGRETELARLDAAWESAETHVLTFVAFGGMGKSALVSHWLDRMAAAGWRGALRVLDWSFYSQGTEERVTSADRFLDHALAWFGDPDPKAGASRDRGLRLAELVRRERTLLVLDGVEPLQHPPSHPLAGRLKDPGLAALLKGLAGANAGLCVVTTRERIADLESFSRTAPQEDLEALSPEAGAELLNQLGVKGKASELLAASREFGDAFQRMANRARPADALHQAGRWEESAEVFREAEALQAERQPEYPRLYSLQGYRYCDLLLSLGEPEDGAVPDSLAADPEAARRFREACLEVRERAEEALKIVLAGSRRLLDIALNHLSLGRAHLGLALAAPRPAAPGEEAEADFAKAAEHLDHAVEGLRRAGQEQYLPYGLLARAALWRFRGDLPAAEADLSEALEIAQRGSMRLYECDAHLEWARLCRQRGDRDGLERHVAQARKLVEETGYARRRREVEWLARGLPGFRGPEANPGAPAVPG